MAHYSITSSNKHLEKEKKKACVIVMHPTNHRAEPPFFMFKSRRPLIYCHPNPMRTIFFLFLLVLLRIIFGSPLVNEKNFLLPVPLPLIGMHPKWSPKLLAQ